MLKFHNHSKNEVASFFTTDVGDDVITSLINSMFFENLNRTKVKFLVRLNYQCRATQQR